LWLATFHIMEMLYDTPYPETPQTDRIEKPERNAEIIARYEVGETGAHLAEAFGISEQRVNQIVRGKRR
jgi:Mor family transcriptional regulator